MESVIPALTPEGDRGYISANGVHNLESYAYRGKDESLLVKYILRFFWDWLLVRFVPIDLAPNVITLCGLGSVCTAFLLVFYHTDGVEGWAPNWIFTAVALLIFTYQTLDNLDGKQARRTGSSSALGEVFDHGADALTIPMFAIIMGCTFQLGPFLSWISFLMLATLFYLPHWEGYFTGVLLLRRFSNPTEGQWSLIVGLLVTTYAGTLWWRDEVNTVILGYSEIRTVLVFFSFLGFVSTAWEHISAVYLVTTSRGQSMKGPIMALFPLIFLLLSSSLWAAISPALLFEYPRLYIGTVGMVFGYIVIRIIVQGVTKEPFKVYYNVLTPIVAFSLHSLFGKAFGPLLDDTFILQCYFVCALVHNMFLCSSLVFEFSVYLKIRPFSIKTLLPTVQPDV